MSTFSEFFLIFCFTFQMQSPQASGVKQETTEEWIELNWQQFSEKGLTDKVVNTVDHVQNALNKLKVADSNFLYKQTK